MVNIKQIARSAQDIKGRKAINWFPGHMYSGMKAMIGKLNTVDCVVEVHDARIPFTGRNSELKGQLGLIKPHILVLNKSDLADLSRWTSIERRLHEQNDKNVLLTDLTGSEFSFTQSGYPKLINKVVELINQSDRFNRQGMDFFQVMIVGIPNVGKSTLINRLRQHHLGIKGNPAKIGPYAGVTRHVDNKIKICSRPPIYSIDTPGILEPGSTKDANDAMRLALCSTINDGVLNTEKVARFLLDYLNDSENYMYTTHLGLKGTVHSLEELIDEVSTRLNLEEPNPKFGGTIQQLRENQARKICWDFIKGFRRGYYGKIMLD